MARLGYSITINGLEDDTLVVRGFEGQESLSDSMFKGKPCYGFKYRVELASRKSDILPEQMVDHVAELTLYRDDVLVQRINGVIRKFSQGDIGHNYTYYEIILVPALERLSLRQNSRLFQLKTVPEIISTLLQEMNITEFAFDVQRECAQREFCVQYRETDLAFLHRLAAEEGLVYSFVHEEGKHTVLFTDATSSLPSITDAIPYNTLAGGVNDTPYIWQFAAHTQSEVATTAMQDYSFKKPAYSFAQSAQGTSMDYQLADYEHFDAPGRFKDDVSGKAFTQIRQEYLRRNAQIVIGKSNQQLMRAGYQFTLSDHLNEAMNQSYVTVLIQHKGEQPQAVEEEGGSGSTTYVNQFKAIPSTFTWRATPQPKPQVDGPMMAFVVGPEGEEIFCDEFGRVKVHFPWDRYSNANEQSSCWVRVSQGWAGPQYGTLAIPRIGHEVIVSFLNGDPDQPIITGRTYHATNTHPYTLPDNKTKTVLRTETHQGEGYNEVSFEDQSGSEKIFVHAQKDYEALVENDHIQVINHDKHLTVDNDAITKVKNNQHLTIKGESRTNIKKNNSINASGSIQQKVSDKTIIDSGSEVHLKAGNKIVLDGGDELTIAASGSFIKLDASGVTVVGSAVNLNSGGSAGAGSGYAGLIAKLPTSIAEAVALVATEAESVVGLTPADPKLYSLANPALISLEALEQISVANVPLAKMCQKQADGSCLRTDCKCIHSEEGA